MPAPAATRNTGALLRRGTVIAVVALGVGWPVGVALSDTDGPTDLRGFASWWARVWSAVPWPATAVLVAVAVVHHLAAAVAARAASGRPLPWGETVAAQFAASAVNRITPGGLGGDALNARFFARRGGLRAAESAGAVSALVVFGALADLLALLGVVAVAALLGVPGIGTYSSALVRVLTRLSPGSVWWWVGGAVAVAAAAAAVVAFRQRGRRAARRALAAAARYAVTIRDLAADPRRLLTLAGASASTTLVLGAGFATTAVLSGSGVPVRMFGAVLIGYMVGSAVGNVIPVPGGVGTTDAAFVAVLVTAGMPVAQATGTALLFRVVTFWAPAALGVPALRLLQVRKVV